ncbi:MAG: hypothetical protein AAF085_15815, partial [Planctomycetota bacterium]
MRLVNIHISSIIIGSSVSIVSNSGIIVGSSIISSSRGINGLGLASAGVRCKVLNISVFLRVRWSKWRAW